MEDRKSILVVDDDEFLLKSVKEILQLEGYYVDAVETGQEAIEKSKTRFYNLTLLDIKLPDIEGTKLLQMMHETLPKMVKFMVTGYPSLENAVEALNSGADAYLMKPINPQKMLKVVKEELKKQEEAQRMSQEGVKKWIETRVQKLAATDHARV